MVTKNSYTRLTRGVFGPSFHDVTVRVPFAHLVAAIGEPNPRDLDTDKVKHEWTFAGPNGTVRVYDYGYDGVRTGEWHLGGRDKQADTEFKRWLQARICAVKLCKSPAI